ncbi:unnamed protein product [Dicrocoelium dendriticum]|nr:unnamed protein product [Dicrocoelium dendriticum]
MDERSRGSSPLSVSPPTESLFRPSVLNPSCKPVFPANGVQASASIPPASSAVSSLPPSSAASAPATSHSHQSIPSDYVFGSNISSRVVNANISEGASSIFRVASCDPVNSSASVFVTLAKAVSSNSTDSASETLVDSASKVMEDQKQAALNLDPVELITGEEGEQQIFRQHCRAYVFDIGKQKWNALGACHFHLNDNFEENGSVGSTGSYRSRVVVRLTSTQKLMINTAIWADMPLALVDPKSLRIGAVSLDGEHIKSYLLIFPPDESASKIFRAISERKRKAKEEASFDPEVKYTVASHKRHTDSPSERPEKVFITANSSVADYPQPTFINKSSTSEAEPHATSKVHKTNIFRPSVLSSASSVICGASTSHSFSASSSGVHFRQSALDTVVKRLKDDEISTPKGSCPSVNVLTENRPSVSNHFELGNEQPFLSNLPPSSVGTHCPDFVFGRNVAERATATHASGSDTSHSYRHSEGKPVAKMSGESDAEDSDHITEPPCELTLTNSANAVVAEMQEKTSLSLTELPQSVAITGEEGECTVLKTYCQFYCFDRQKQAWTERGQAYLHLNDIPAATSTDTTRVQTGPPTRSRLVARVCKTLKLLANTPIWSGMKVNMADERSIRLTTLCYSNVDESLSTCENQGTGDNISRSSPEFYAYLMVMRSPKHATRLYQALVSRMNVLNERRPDKYDAPVKSDNADHSPSEVPGGPECHSSRDSASPLT